MHYMLSGRRGCITHSLQIVSTYLLISKVAELHSPVNLEDSANKLSVQLAHQSISDVKLHSPDAWWAQLAKSFLQVGSSLLNSQVQHHQPASNLLVKIMMDQGALCSVSISCQA